MKVKYDQGHHREGELSKKIDIPVNLDQKRLIQSPFLVMAAIAL